MVDHQPLHQCLSQRIPRHINQANVKVDGTTLLFNGSNQFKFKKDWSAELSGWYRSTGVEGVFVIQPLGQVSTAAAKQVMKGKGTSNLA
jgi:hypothetical protein